MKNFKKRLFNRSNKLNPELVELFISVKFYGNNIVKFDFNILPTGINKSYNSDALNKNWIGDINPFLDKYKAVNGDIMVLYGHFAAAINV